MTTIYRKDYAAPNFKVNQLRLTFDLFEEVVVVDSYMHIERIGDGVLSLDGEHLDLISVMLNGSPLGSDTYQQTANKLTIHNFPNEGTIEIKTRIKPQENTELSGLYRSSQLFCTQCEAHGFRRITYFFDRPDVLTKYTTKIIADKKKYPQLLSNGNLVDSGDTNDGRHWVVWEDPFKKPCYLFALVAGNLKCVTDSFVTQSARTIALKIFVEPGNEHKCDHAMASLKRAMRWDEVVFGREYDLDIFMIVAVSDFNMGAMENKGLNIFNDKYILATPETATDQDFKAIESVVAHEYFHNWTGNRVTCRDWFQLSLKEGLTVFRDQEFSRDMHSRDVNRIEDVMALRNTQFPEDAGAMAHPVRPDAYQEINNFYTATVYNKGAEVIRMQHMLLGAKGFRAGMDLYFERHDGQAVTIDDFVRAQEDANQVDLTQFKRWYSHKGTPIIDVKTHFSQGTLSITLKQSLPEYVVEDAFHPFHIPIAFALFDDKGTKIPLKSDVLELAESIQTFEFKDLPARPIVSLLREFSSPVQLNFTQSDGDRILLLKSETDGFSCYEQAQILANQAIRSHYQQHTKQIEPQLLQTFNELLTTRAHDDALLAELLLMPSFNNTLIGMQDVDIRRLAQSRDFYARTVGEFIFETAQSLFNELNAQALDTMTSEAFKQRKLKQACLGYMMKAREKTVIGLCHKNFQHAKTMTDELACFRLLINADDQAQRNEALQTFYKKWQKEPLVINKWFTEQALCDHDDTLLQVQKLMSHPDFSIKNPNRIYSLIGAFCFGNPAQFHREDKKGYEFLADVLLELDKINPQMSAKMAVPLTRFQPLNEILKQGIFKSLTFISAQSISQDLRELTDKSLQVLA